MSIEETVKALRWIAKNDEVVFNAEQANIAADQLEQLQAENERLKAEKPVTCGECINLIERHYEDKGEKPYIKYGCKYRGSYQVHTNEFCSYGERRDVE
ncbi:hypothetical protein [Anaerotignum sp.]|uniref:hypothetical protein n=1 Tax=Anaerotignum sp. TaxID=2039241 RepID=UPI0027149FEE|nr:hypothetical protein [Anaerotignum sp.]